jgi:hypothetical protein
MTLTDRKTWFLGIAASALAACSTPTPQPPAQAHSHEQIVRDELAGIIVLQGLPCTAVLGYSLDQRLQYQVSCATGERYRVRVSPIGRVSTEADTGNHEAPAGAASAPARR